MSMTDSNPYNFEKPVRVPRLFAGRSKELAEIDYYLEQTIGARPSYYNLSLIGQRAAGKTSFLNMIQHKAENKGLLPVKISLNNESSTNEILLFKEIFDGIATAGAQKDMFGGIKGQIYQNFRKLFDMFEVEAEFPFLFGTVYVGTKDKKVVSNSISQQVLTHDMKKFYEEAKNKNIPAIVLLFDECDLLAANQTLLQKLRNLFSEIDGYVLIFSGTEKMFPSIEEVFSPLPRFFKRISMENFTEVKDTSDCLLKPLSEEEIKSFDQGCIGDIHLLTGGSPYEINLIAHHMYRRWKQGNNNLIGLTSDVLEDVLNEIERLRGTHYEAVNKIKRYWKDHLKILIGLLQFPEVPSEWLSEYLLLDEIDTLSPKDSYTKKSITKDYVDLLKKDGLITEKDGKIVFKGEPFDILYLKYFCVSKGYVEINQFVGSSKDPLLDLHRKFMEILLKDFQEYNTYAGFDKRENKEKRNAQKFTMGFKGNMPPGESQIILFSDETRNQFYLGAPNSVRFRVNVGWMKEGFVTQVKFKTEDDKSKFQNRLQVLSEKLHLLGYQIILKDENQWNVEGTEFLSKGNLEEAIKCFDRSIELNPLFELPWANKASCLLNLKKYDESLECINKALELHSSWSDALRMKGIILINTQKNSEALEYLEKATKINLEDWTAWHNKGIALLNLGKFNEAISSFDHAIKLKNDNYDAIFYKGICLSRLEKYEESLPCFELVSKQTPDNVDVLFQVALCLYNLGESDKAKLIIDTLEQNSITNISIMEIKALVLSSLGKYDEAIQYCDKIIEKSPDYASGWYNRACFKAKKGDKENSLEDLKKAILLGKEYFLDLAKEESDFISIRDDDRFKALITN